MQDKAVLICVKFEGRANEVNQYRPASLFEQAQIIETLKNEVFVRFCCHNIVGGGAVLVGESRGDIRQKEQQE